MPHQDVLKKQILMGRVIRESTFVSVLRTSGFRQSLYYRSCRVFSEIKEYSN